MSKKTRQARILAAVAQPAPAPAAEATEPQALVVAPAGSPEFDPAANRRVGKSVIPALYKKLHTMDALASQVSSTIRDGDGKVDARLLAALAARNSLDAGRWAHLNIGMQVMALTNTLRSRAEKGTEVVLAL